MILEQAIEEYLDYLQIKRFVPATIKNAQCRLRYLERHLGTNTNLSEITNKDLQKFLISPYPVSLARGTYNHYIALLRGFFGFYHDTGQILVNPAKPLEFVREEQRIVEYFTLEELRAILQTDHKYRYGPVKEFIMRDRTLVHLGALCGLRSSEARFLRWQQVNLEYGEIHVICGKNLKDRIVPMPKITWDLLKSEYKRKHPDKSDFVLYGFKEKPMNHEIINSVIQRLCKDAGVDKRWPHFHMLRHTCATLYLKGKPKKRGMDIRVLKELLGHADISTTQKYAHVDKAFLAEEMKRCLPRVI